MINERLEDPTELKKELRFWKNLMTTFSRVEKSFSPKFPTHFRGKVEFLACHKSSFLGFRSY